MRRQFLLLCLCAVFSLEKIFAAEPLVLDLWPNKPPGFQVEQTPEKDMSKPGEGMTGGRAVVRLGNVSKPQIYVFQPPPEKRTGTAVLVCPGGGFNILAFDMEGTEVAEWLNTIGVTAAVLKYRVPTASLKDKKWEPPVQDAQRALSLLRGKAAEWNLKPEQIGTLGFSAGGTTAALAATKLDNRLYEALDDTDKTPCHANFAVLCYPYILFDEKTGKLSDMVEVSEKTPPMFFAHAANDKITCENSIQMFLALKKAQVKGSELHVYESGGHGFGMRTPDPCSTWPKRCAEWLAKRGLLTK